MQFLLAKLFGRGWLIGSCVIDIKIFYFHIYVYFLISLSIGRSYFLLTCCCLIFPISRISRRYNIFGMMIRFFWSTSKIFIFSKLKIFLTEIIRCLEDLLSFTLLMRLGYRSGIIFHISISINL